MAGRASGKKAKGGKKATPKAKARVRPLAPVLGNDPFERGAAPRTRAAGAPTAGGKAVASTAPAKPSATPTPSTSLAKPSPAKSSQASGRAPDQAQPGQGFSALRDRLESLEQRVESATESAAHQLGELARDEASGRAAQDLRQALSGLGPALRERMHALGALRALFARGGALDAHGLDRELWQRAEPALDFLYGTWWRVATHEVENVPASGPVVVVANHGGALPWDALVLRFALEHGHPARRDLRPLLDQHALDVPLAGNAFARLGAVPATPENAQRLLAEGLAVAVFPEGSRAGARPSTQRYRLEQFGRGGFAKVALRARATIVPCAIVGSEETSAPFARPGWLAEWLNIPALSGTPALPLAPLALVPLPSRWSLRFGSPIAADAGPQAADDPATVIDLTERTREALQAMLDEDVAARRSVYL